MNISDQIKMCIMISSSLWIFCLVVCVPLTHGQVDCSPSGQEQCDLDFYCGDDFKCKKCATCEHFEPSNVSCAKSVEECGICREGYEFHGPGKCVEKHNISIFFLWVGAATILIILIFISVGAGLYHLRKKYTAFFGIRESRYNLEVDNLNTVVVTSSAPQRPSAPPPYSSSPQPPFNPFYTGSSKPKLDSLTADVQDIEMERQQMANPYSNSVRLPPDIHRYNNDQFDENGNLNGHVDVREDVNSVDSYDSNEEAASRRARGRLPAERAPLLSVESPEPADPAPSQDLAILDITTPGRDLNTALASMDRSHDDDCESASTRSRPASPTSYQNGTQHLIVQLINNISPILNLQGNNTRR